MDELIFTVISMLFLISLSETTSFKRSAKQEMNNLEWDESFYYSK